MKQFKVKTPNEGFNGTRSGVRFEKGEATAELSEQQVIDFKQWGYVVEEVVEEAPKQKTTRKTNTKKNEK